MTKKHYNKEFKERAVALWQSSDKSAAAIEDDLDITRGLLYKWQQRLRKDGREAFRGSGKLTTEQENVRQLERELAVVKEEREILKTYNEVVANTRK